MNVAFNRNYPSFNLKDTFIYSKDFSMSPDISTSLYTPISPFSLKKSNKPQLVQLLHKKNYSELTNLPILSDDKTGNSKILKKRNSFLTPYLNMQKHNPNDNEFNPTAIIDYLNSLEKNPQNVKKLFANIRLRKRKPTMKSMDLTQPPKNLENFVNPSKSSPKKGYLEIVTNFTKKGSPKKLTQNNMPSPRSSLKNISPLVSPTLHSMISPTMPSTTMFSPIHSKSKESINNFDFTNKKNSVVFDPNPNKFMNSGTSTNNQKNTSAKKPVFKKSTMKHSTTRYENIVEYPKLLEIIRKLHLNFREVNEKNENKLMTIHLLHSLIPTRKKYLESLFFLGDKLNPIINERTLENACILQENQYGFGFKEKLLRPGLIKDLEELNILLEDHNLKKEELELKFLEENVKHGFNEISKLKSKDFWLSNVDTLNYESIKHNTIIDDLMEAERNLGKFECIASKQKAVGKLIDETIQNLRKSNKREILEMKFMQENFRLV